MDCEFSSTQRKDGSYHHACRRCGRAYVVPSPHLYATCRAGEVADSAGGPGTELHKLLAAFGLRDFGGCPCRRRAAEMDAKGVAWCRANLDTIAGWLVEAAAHHPLLKYLARNWLGRLLLKYLARAVVREAIRRAEKKQAAASAIADRKDEG
jgi:hypothetical protein